METLCRQVARGDPDLASKLPSLPVFQLQKHLTWSQMCSDETIDLNSAAGRPANAPSPSYLVPGADPSFSAPAAVFISDLVPLRGKRCLKGASETTSAVMADLQGSRGCRDPRTVIRFIYKKETDIKID